MCESENFSPSDALTRGTIQDELIRVWSGSDQTIFMITHDVDEAILLADRILLMSNGPYATVAESVVIDIPRPRKRADIIHHPAYYAIRNHLVDFLTTRSKKLSDENAGEKDTRNQKPLTVRPGLMAEQLPEINSPTEPAQTQEPTLSVITGTQP